MLGSDPNHIFQGTILIVAPHMDDEALACGGLIASLSHKERIHIIYATDGMKSPSPILPYFDAISADLGSVRMMESTEAMNLLGVPKENLRFLGFPEAHLRKNKEALTDLLFQSIKVINPDYIFIPFRFDRHSDHLVINQVMVKGLKRGRFMSQLVEYFIYHRWRLLPVRDIRAYIKPEFLISVDITSVSAKKRMVLDCYKSQTTKFYSWQTRPILTPVLLDEESQTPEYFLIRNPALPDTAVFSKFTLWIRFTHRLEPFLKKWMYLAGAILKRMSQSYARNAG